MKQITIIRLDKKCKACRTKKDLIPNGFYICKDCQRYFLTKQTA